MIRKLTDFITFVDLPIRKKFALFSLGVLFWFVVMSIIGIMAGSDMSRRASDIVNVIVPNERVSQKVLSKLQELRNDSAEMTGAADVKTFSLRAELSRARIADIRSFVTALARGGQINDINRDSNTVVDSFTVLPLKYDAEISRHIDGLQSLTADLDKTLQEIVRLRTDILNGAVRDESSFIMRSAEYRRSISEAISVSQAFSTRASALYASASAGIERVTRSAFIVYTGILLTASALLLIFTISISRSITSPVKSIIKRIRALGEGDVILSRESDIQPRDEIQALSDEFNLLMEEIQEHATFKKVIEEDDSLEDVYSRLGRVFSEKLGLPEFTIYEASSDRDTMKPVYPVLIDEKDLSCNEEILHSSDLCKVKKTGHSVSSIQYPDICRQFRPTTDREHVCIPMIIGGKTGGVIQFLFDRKDAAHDRKNNRIFKAEQYVKESLSVLEAKRLMNTLRESALKDSLTGLYNRRFLQEYTETLVAGVLRREKSVGLIMCDLDFFKQVNDLYGHNVGDSVLKETADIIRKCIRSSDLVIRFGGEEFLVLMLDINTGETMKVAEKIRESIEKTKIHVSDGVIKKTISLGVSEFPLDTESFWHAIKFADVALYRAKEKGRNRVIRFTKDMWSEKE